MPGTPMPFVEDTLRRARTLAPDLWTYGVSGNEAAIEMFLDTHHLQGLSNRRLEIAELFHPATTESYAL